ncbi:MAG: hypothetical protein ACRC9I_07505, partial [Acinetobacter sp.]
MKLTYLVLLTTVLCISVPSFAITISSAQIPATTPLAKPDPRPDPKPTPVPTAIPSPPQITAKAYLLMDYNSGQLLFGENPEVHLPP